MSDLTTERLDELERLRDEWRAAHEQWRTLLTGESSRHDTRNRAAESGSLFTEALYSHIDSVLRAARRGLEREGDSELLDWMEEKTNVDGEVYADLRTDPNDEDYYAIDFSWRQNKGSAPATIRDVLRAARSATPSQETRTEEDR